MASDKDCDPNDTDAIAPHYPYRLTPSMNLALFGTIAALGLAIAAIAVTQLLDSGPGRSRSAND